MKNLLILLGILIVFGLYWYSKERKKNTHLSKPAQASEPQISEEFIDGLVNSDYAINLDQLRNHVTGHKVINSVVGNAGFLIYLDNNSWALAYREGNIIKSDFGTGGTPENKLQSINSDKFGDATDGILEDKPYAQDKNDNVLEIKKSHGQTLEGLAVGQNTFNFAFEDGMELDFQLCNDKNDKPAIRIFWEQW